MQISINAEIEHIISRQLQSGKYSSTGEVIRTALLLLEQNDFAGSPDDWKQECLHPPQRRSPKGIMADIKSNIRVEEIRDVRNQMWSSFPRDEG